MNLKGLVSYDMKSKQLIVIVLITLTLTLTLTPTVAEGSIIVNINEGDDDNNYIFPSASINFFSSGYSLNSFKGLVYEVVAYDDCQFSFGSQSPSVLPSASVTLKKQQQQQQQQQGQKGHNEDDSLSGSQTKRRRSDQVEDGKEKEDKGTESDGDSGVVALISKKNILEFDCLTYSKAFRSLQLFYNFTGVIVDQGDESEPGYFLDIARKPYESVEDIKLNGVEIKSSTWKSIVEVSPPNKINVFCDEEPGKWEKQKDSIEILSIYLTCAALWAIVFLFSCYHLILHFIHDSIVNTASNVLFLACYGSLANIVVLSVDPWSLNPEISVYLIPIYWTTLVGELIMFQLTAYEWMKATNSISSVDFIYRVRHVWLVISLLLYPLFAGISVLSLFGFPLFMRILLGFFGFVSVVFTFIFVYYGIKLLSAINSFPKKAAPEVLRLKIRVRALIFFAIIFWTATLVISTVNVIVDDTQSIEYRVLIDVLENVVSIVTTLIIVGIYVSGYYSRREAESKRPIQINNSERKYGSVN